VKTTSPGLLPGRGMAMS